MFGKNQQSRKNNIRTSAEEDLQVLILNRNYKFGDVSLQQLICTLKNDFWLRRLHLRCCGITQNGGEIVLEFLQRNSVLTQINLKDNELPIDMLLLSVIFWREEKVKRKEYRQKKDC